MPFSEENWNDMRRFDYSPEIFLAYNKSYYYRENRDNVQKYCPEGSSPRRWPQASYETKYNVKQLQACYDLVPWASKYLPNATKENWYNDDLICTLPVWWDIAD